MPFLRDWSKASGTKASFLSLAALFIIPLSSLTGEELPRVASATGPRSEDRIITRYIRRAVEEEHISGRKFDDEISRRAYDQFLRKIDPMKLYLFKVDVEEFDRYREKLDDDAQKGDVGFAYLVSKKQMQRIQELMPMVHEWIDAVHDFNVDETIAVDREVVDYSKDMAEAKERWRKQIKYSLLALKADKKTDEQAREQLHRRFRTVEKTRMQMDVYELLELYLSCLTESLDPHTSYLAPRARDNFNIQLGLKLEGIGATLTSEDGVTVISSTVPGGAAAKDGRLKKGDKIIAVGQENSPEMVDVVDMKLDDVVSLIRGPAGTKVRLSVQPKVGNETTMIEITRAKIELSDAAARGEILERGMKADGSPFRVGYIKLPSFYFDLEGNKKGDENVRSTTVDMENILNGFTKSGVDVVVLDLSMNGGGSLSEAISCTGLFIDRGPVVQVKDSDGTVRPHEDDDPGVAWDGPLVVMTSKMSASASEIFAGAIKDYGRGIVVGDPTTHGKGTVQTLVDVGMLIFNNAAKPYGALKLTIQQFYLPDGRSTQREGVAADVTLPSLTAQMPIGEADLDYALPVDKVPAREHKQYGLVDNNIREDLTRLSQARIEKSEDFEKLERRIKLYLQQKEEKFASLKESDFMAKRAEFDAEKEEEDQLKKQEENKDVIYDKTYYNEEILNVTIDYVRALGQRKLAQAR